MQFRKKPVVIEAFQFQRRNNGPIPYPDWYGDAVTHDDVITHNTGKWHDPTQPAYCEIKTLEGVMRADENDWIIRGVKGEIYPCKPDIFAATYEPAPDAAPVHNSDCSLHNEPAMPAGPCDCSVSSMTFGQALEAIKRGQGVGRTGWNGKGMWIGLHEETGTFVRKSCGTELQYRDYIVMKTVDNELVPWVASQTDLLAEDWQIVE